MKRPDLKKTFLSLVRLGIGQSVNAMISVADWPAIQALAYQHGLSGVIIDGIEKLPASYRPPQELLLQWIGEVMQNYEERNRAYEKSIAELASFYNRHGYKMMVLKGYACMLDWPRPEHRPCGDIDIWQFGKQKEADSIIEIEKGIKIDKSHHHHTVFNWHGFAVENHYDFVNIHAHRSSAELEKIFKELGKDDSNYVEMGGAIGSATKVYLPSPNLHALFLIRHMVSHFAAAEISLRHVLDWAFFVEKHGKEVDWKWLQSVLDKYHMMDFFNLINAICMDDLGFEARFFRGVQLNPQLKDRILEDILEPEYGLAGSMAFFQGIVYKYKRWQGNAWKQKLCYNESRWEYFWSGIWAKMLKPASF